MGYLVSALAPTAAVFPYAGTTAPDGWLLCDGSAISRATYSSLFAAIGISYGSGDGSTTFNLPDYRWAFLRGYGPNIDSTSGAGTVSNNNIVINNHGFNRSGIKIKIPAAIVLPAGLAFTDYWVIVIDSNTIAFATSRNNATELTPIKVSISGSYSNVRVSQIEDPDIALRKRNARGGNFEGNIGSWQEDNFKGHGHSISGTSGALNPLTYASSFGGGGSYFGVGSGGSQLSYGSNVVQANSVGNNENRPSNVSVNYIIKV